MYTAKVTTPKALRANNGVGESFRYYASAGSVPFIWESQPGTPKHAHTESILPPLTPPPSYHHLSHKFNSSMQVTKNHSSKRSSFFRTVFLSSYGKRNMSPPPPSSLSSCSASFSSSSSSSNLHSWHSTPMSRTEVRRAMSAVKFEFEEEDVGDSPTWCFGGGFKKSYRIKKMKKAMFSFVRNGKAC